MLRRDMQTQTKYVIGVDFGSDSVRCLIVGTADGAEIASAVAAYPRWKERLYCDPSLNRYRQHPLDYIESLEQCVRSALEKCGKEVADNICGISFDTTASTPALTDERGVPLALLPEYAENPDAMFVLWKDHTALAEADEINDLAKRWEVDYTRYSGGAYSCEWVWAKMLHCLRSDPALRAKTCSWVEHCDWKPVPEAVVWQGTRRCGMSRGAVSRRPNSSRRSIRCWIFSAGISIPGPLPVTNVSAGYAPNGPHGWDCGRGLQSAWELSTVMWALSGRESFPEPW